MEKQILYQDVQNLTGIIESSREQSVKSVAEFSNRLKRDLDYSTEG